MCEICSRLTAKTLKRQLASILGNSVKIKIHSENIPINFSNILQQVFLQKIIEVGGKYECSQISGATTFFNVK